MAFLRGIRSVFYAALSAVAVILFVLVILPFFAITMLCQSIAAPFIERSLRAEWKRTYEPAGKRFFVLYSDSPKSKEWIEAELVPLLGDKALVVNKSRSRLWQTSESFEHRAGDHWGSMGAPLVVFIPQVGPKECIDLGPAAKASWHRKDMSGFANALARIQQLALHDSPRERLAAH